MLPDQISAIDSRTRCADEPLTLSRRERRDEPANYARSTNGRTEPAPLHVERRPRRLGPAARAVAPMAVNGESERRPEHHDSARPLGWAPESRTGGPTLCGSID